MKEPKQITEDELKSFLYESVLIFLDDYYKIVESIINLAKRNNWVKPSDNQEV